MQKEDLRCIVFSGAWIESGNKMNKKQKKALFVIKENGGNITLPVFATQMNAGYQEASYLLKSIIKKYNCNFLVTENGELIYDFGKNINIKISLLEQFKNIIGLLSMVITELSFGLMYITLRWTIWLPIYITGKLIKKDISDSDKITNITLNEMINTIRPQNPRITNFKIPEEKELKNFSCYSRIKAEFLQKWHINTYKKNREKAFMRYVESVDGIVAPIEWAILFNTGLQEAEKSITDLYIKYESDIRVSESGELFFDFSAELGKHKKTPPIPEFYKIAFLKALIPSKEKNLIYFSVLTILFLVSYTSTALIIISLFSDVPSVSACLDSNTSIFIISILPGLIIMMINWPAYTYPMFGVLSLMLIAGSLLLLLEIILKLTGNTEIMVSITNSQLMKEINKNHVIPLIIFSSLWLLGSLLAFPTVLISTILRIIFMKKNNYLFKMALHSYLVKDSDKSIPITPFEVAEFLNHYTSYKVPIPSNKSFIHILDEFKAELRDDKFIFSIVNAQITAILTEKPLHKISKNLVYSSNDDDL